MHRVRITLSNYRGFSDENPAVFELGGEAGFTALVGPNNSGKSSLMKFFYELRPLFYLFNSHYDQQLNYERIFNENALIIQNHPGIPDESEIYFNENSRAVRVDAEIISSIYSENFPDADCLTRVSFVRTRREMWHAEVFGSKHPFQKLRKAGNMAPWFRPHICFIDHENLKMDCSAFAQVMQIFHDSKYFGSFRNALNEGGREHFDMQIGTNFVATWDAWKNGGNKDKADRIERVTRDIENLFHFDRLEISASTDKKMLLVKIEGKTYRLEELGSGVAQFIVALGNAAMQSPSLLLIDEPEANLHPSLQLSFLSMLAGYAREGVVFSTHSLGLARSVANDIYTVQYRDGRRTVRPFAATPNYAEFLGELSFSAFQDLGGEALFLVEGVNDVKTLHEFLRLFEIERQVIVFPIGGNQFISGDRTQELSEIQRLCKRVFVLIDSEREAEGAKPEAKRRDFKKACEDLGFTVCLTEKRAIENYLTDSAVKKAFGEKYRALTPYEKLESAEPAWRKAESWKIARLMTKDEIEKTDVGQILAALCTKPPEENSLGSPHAI